MKNSFPVIGEIVHEDGIRFYSDNDIAAMKIQAILNRGQKKDFWDIAELLQHYSLKQMTDWHAQKFPNQLLAISIPYALTYFTDAEASENPRSLKGQPWEDIKAFICQKTREHLT